MGMWKLSFQRTSFLKNVCAKVVISKNFLSHEWVCETCHFKELPFTGMGMWKLLFQRTSFLMNGYVKVIISKNFLSQEWVCKSCHFKELPFSWMGIWKLPFQRTSFLMNGYVKIVISKNFLSHEWVYESCHFKELHFSWLREFHEITATSPTKINNVDCENFHISNFQSHRKHLSIGYLNTHSVVSSFDEFNVMLKNFPLIYWHSQRWCKFTRLCSNTWL